MKWCRTLAALYLAVSTVRATTSDQSDHYDHDSHSDHDSHTDHSGHSDHDEHLFEAAAVYTLEAGTNSLVAVPADDIPDESFAFMLVPAASADLEGLESAEEDAEAAWEAFKDGEVAPTVMTSEVTVIPDASVVYQVILDESILVFPAEISDAGDYALLLEHTGAEVDTAIMSPSRTVVTAAVTEGMEDDHDEEEEEDNTVSGSRWAQALVATTISCCTSLIGILLLINKRIANGIDLSLAYMFAVGAILTAATVHVIPEAFERFENSDFGLYDLGVHVGGVTGAGFVISIIVHIFGRAEHSHSEEGGTGPTTPKIPQSLWELVEARKGKALLDLKGLMPICYNVIIGDAVHAFTCGFTIGAAFLSCDSKLGWLIFASTIAHEVPSEMADFVALLKGGMSVKQAVVWNLLSGIPGILGTILILALGSKFSDFTIAIMFLLGAGSLIVIGLTELLPEAAASPTKGWQGSVYKLVAFAVGALTIGLPLMGHQHCHGGEGHEGHDH